MASVVVSLCDGCISQREPNAPLTKECKNVKPKRETTIQKEENRLYVPIDNRKEQEQVFLHVNVPKVVHERPGIVHAMRGKEAIPQAI